MIVSVYLAIPHLDIPGNHFFTRRNPERLHRMLF
jgi:hypothetical protein